jgi:hypothetical protein
VHCRWRFFGGEPRAPVLQSPPLLPRKAAPGGVGMSKRFVVAWVVLFVLWMLEGMVVHGIVLGPDYKGLPQLFRPEADAQGQFGWMILAHVLVSGAFVWIYERGIAPDKGWLEQGMRYGIAVALLTVVPTYLIYFAVQPLPGALVGKQIVLDAIGLLVFGIVVAWLYRPRTAG